MKAITIWQPWASLLACGAKQYETRSWATSYRGPIAIHAAKKNVLDTLALIPAQVKDEMKKHIEAMVGVKCENLPTGVVIATAELVNVWHIAQHPGTNIPRLGDYFVSRKEAALGDWTPGRYAWELANVKVLPEPIPIKRKQGLWNWEEGER